MEDRTEGSNPACTLVLFLPEVLYYRTQEQIFPSNSVLQGHACLYEILNLLLQDLLQQYFKTHEAGAAALIRNALSSLCRQSVVSKLQHPHQEASLYLLEGQPEIPVGKTGVC